MSAVARRYASAAFELARDSNSLDQVVAQLKAFAAAYEQSDDFRQLDKLPQLDDEQRAAIVVQLGKKLGASDMVVRLITMLAQRQRLGALLEMVELVAEMADESQGVVRATVTSARKLSPAYLRKLEQSIAQSTGNKVIITTREDPQLIAGVVTQIGDRVVDGSIRGRLDRLADSLRQT